MGALLPFVGGLIVGGVFAPPKGVPNYGQIGAPSYAPPPMYYSNPYTIGETKTENLNLLPFSEIMKTYEKMMVVTNADNMEYEKSRVYDIDRIVLGYARIYEPSTDPHTGLLVPVWDFFGSRKVEGDYDGNSYSDITDYPNWSFLTINAVDGSIIDRDLGY